MQPAPGRSSLLTSLAEATRRHPLERKLLVCNRPAEGRELLRALSASGTAWTGWEVTTVRKLAHERVAVELAGAGLQVADEFDLQALVDEAIESVEARGRAGPLGRMKGAAGLREVIRGAIETLRVAGMGPDQVEAARPDDPKLRALAEMLRELEARLASARKVDDGELLRRAARALSLEGGTGAEDAKMFLLPGLPLRGRAGTVVRRLLDRGARPLAAESMPVRSPPSMLREETRGGDPAPLSLLQAPERAGDEVRPSIHLFAAATPAEELREILRRIIASEVPWDRVEIVATDPGTYGAALDSLARRLGVPVTFAAGLDIRRTRVGRAIGGYLRWVEEGFPADLFRALLDSGDLELPRGTSGAALANRLRRLRIGWGADRYLPAIADAIAELEAPRVSDESTDPEQASALRDRAAAELAALRSILQPILASSPALTRRTRPVRGRTSPAALARGAQVFLERVRAADEAEHTLRSVYRERLDRIAESLRAEASEDAALGILRGHLETRVSGVDAVGLTPWTSTPGRLHLTDLVTGGMTGRPHVFVVGLDAARTSSGGGPDPLLTDADRRLLNERSGEAIPPLALSVERAAEQRFRVAATLARLRGEVTLSYSAWDAFEGRAVSPAPELLQALRLREGDVALSYEQLYEALGPLACAVPTGGRALDETDVWMDALVRNGALRSGGAAVRAGFPGLHAGLAAGSARRGEAIGEFHGRLGARAGFDPRDPAGPVLSASRLQKLGACPRRYFYEYVLGVLPQEDPEWDPERWLTPAERGTLLHSVYERALREAGARSLDLSEEGFSLLALRILEEEARRTERRSPPPGETVRALEMESLREDVLAFSSMVGSSPPSWKALELRFGPGEQPVVLWLPRGGGLRVRGAIDRLDDVGEGRLRVVDYKTGGSRSYREGAPFAGGRRIQHALYAAAAEQLEGAVVDSMEYHFPTRRGENQRVRYGAGVLSRGLEVLDRLCDLAAEGIFLTTESHEDCRYCEFKPVCRSETDAYGGVRTERVEWARSRCWNRGKRREDAPAEYAPLLELRGIDG